MARVLQLQVIFFSFVLVNYFPHTVTSDNSCPAYSCSSPTNGPSSIRFPFWLTNFTGQPRRCRGYPGFNLSCNNRTNQTIINLPNAGNFIVNAIEYETQFIWINDPDRCLPKRFLERTFDLSNSPFISESTKDFAFFNCSSESLSGSRPTGTRIVPCLSGENYTVVAVPTMDYVEFSYMSFTTSCKAIDTVLVLGWDVWSGRDETLLLNWMEPDCRSCEKRGGTCGFKSSSGMDIGCSDLPSNGLPRSAKYGIIIGAGIPGLLCIIGFACYLSGRVRAFYRRHQPSTEFSTSIAQQPSVVLSGLDLPTIESFPKTLLGESRRLPKPNDSTCPICLSEYQPKEILRTIPECNHYFHVDCIDEWLRVKGTCPLCRKSPDGSAQITPSTSSTSSSSSSSLLSSP